MEGEEYAEEHEGYEDEQAEGFTDIPIGDANGPTTPRVVCHSLSSDLHYIFRVPNLWT